MSISERTKTFVSKGVSKQESRLRVSGFVVVVVVCVQVWVTFSLVETKKCNMLAFSKMRKLVFIQTNLRMLESMGTNDTIQELNLDDIDITKVPSLPSRLEIKDQTFFMN